MEKNDSYRRVAAFEDNTTYCDNAICTTNYRWWNFVPKNLYKQFHRAANWFFVTMLALNWIPQLNAIGKHFSVMPLLIVIFTDAIKDLYEDIRRGKQDEQINQRECYVYDKFKFTYFKQKWRDIKVGNVIKVLCKQELPADCVLIDTSDEFGFAYADTSLLDGETNLKQKFLPKIPDFENTGLRNLSIKMCVDKPNNDLSKLNGYIESEGDKVALNLDNFMLRGSELRNTDYIIGLVIYAGHDTKAMQNNKGARPKRSKVEKILNTDVFIILAMLLSMCSISAFGQWIWLQSYDGRQAPFLPIITEKLSYVAFLSFFVFLIVFNQLIPMSLYIMLELTKVIQIWFLRQDLDLFGTKSVLCRSMSIAEDLGQVEYIFSDKTGTLTENQMIFKCITCSRRIYGETSTGRGTPSELVVDEGGGVRPPVNSELLAASTSDENVKTMMVGMAVCNTVMVTTEGRRGTSFSQYLPKDFNRIVYEAESPDELSLVNAAREYKFILLRRTPESCVLKQQDVIMRYKVLCSLPFDSSRKCMSIIVIHPRTMKMTMYTKGADTAIFARLRKSVSTDEDALRSTTLDNINKFAKKGLRTLAFAYRHLEQAEYQHFIMKFRQASSKMEGRSEAISKVCDMIEQNLILIGATGVEDKLQESVPEVLTSLRNAGIVVWVLTGDKQETAVSIGYSSQMYSRDTNLLYIRTSGYEETQRRLLELLESTSTGQMHKQALIINGCSMSYVLHPQLRGLFIRLCQTCQTVICCRVTPIQKSQIVSTIKEELKVMTLAVGDGANDVSMLRQANIGIGIAGREGTQAVMASDFAVERFEMLRKLVLVHGHWTYHRIADFILFFFYKNIMFVALEFFYQFFNGFSGNFPQEEFMIITFNTFWTTPGTLVSFTLNQYGGSRDEILADPAVYKQGRHDLTVNKKNFFLQLLEAVYHAAIVFVIHTMSNWGSNISKLEFGGGLTAIAIFIMNVNLLVRSPNITLLLFASCFGTVLVNFVWLLLYGQLGFLYELFKEDPHFTFYMAVKDPIFWVDMLICTILAFLPRIFIRILVSYNPRYSKDFEKSFTSFQTFVKNPGNIFRKRRFEPVSVSLSEVNVETGTETASEARV